MKTNKNKISNKIAERKNIIQEVENNIKIFLEDSRTKKIEYKNAKRQFDYVQNIFIEIDISKANIYFVPYSLMKVNGYGGVAGFYNYSTKKIVVGTDLLLDYSNSKIKAKVTLDETLVHELLHYARHHYNKNNWNVDLEEDFAYGYSIDYFIEKGYSEEEIVNNYLAPYLANKYYSRKRNTNITEFILDRGLKFVNNSKGKSTQVFKTDVVSREDLLDI
jgi:hypothetical protein